MQYQAFSVLVSGLDQHANASVAELQLAKFSSRSDLSFLPQAPDESPGVSDELAGFKRFKASGLSIACSLRYRSAQKRLMERAGQGDRTQSDSPARTVLADGDCGFTTFNNTQLRMHTFRPRSAGGAAPAENGLPMLKSFVADRRALVDIGEFSGRLGAARIRGSCGINLECRRHSTGRTQCRH